MEYEGQLAVLYREIITNMHSDSLESVIEYSTMYTSDDTSLESWNQLEICITFQFHTGLETLMFLEQVGCPLCH